VSPLPHDELPLPDYDHLPTGSLQSRIRSLDADGLQALLDYERAHGNRLPAVQVLQTRLEAVRDGAELTSGSPTAATPEVQTAPSPSPAVNEGPAMNPPSHGDPTNPAQPRG
jgi:hypothetical protein